jgi:hypothetical protein
VTGRSDPGPIWQAYSDADLEHPCPSCHADPNTWCTNTVTGRVRRTPCLARTATQLATTERTVTP